MRTLLSPLLSRAAGCLAAAGLTMGVAAGDDAAPPEAQRRAMIDRLGDASFTARTVAQAELLSAASRDAELAAMVDEMAEAHPSAEVRSRARQVAGQLDHLRRFGRSRITLQATDVTAEEAARLLIEAVRDTLGDGEDAATAAERICLWPPDQPFRGDEAARERKVSLDIVDAPFWTAIRQAGEQTQLWPLEHQDGMQFGVVGQPPAHYPSGTPDDQAGLPAAQVELISISRNRSQSNQFRAGADGRVVVEDANGDSNLSINMRLLVEPKLQVATGQLQIELARVVDDAGRDLAFAGNQYGGYGRLDTGGWSAHLGVGLDGAAAAESTKIAELTGAVALEAVVESRTLRVDLSRALASLDASITEGMLGDAEPEALDADDANKEEEQAGFVGRDVQLEDASGGWKVVVERLALPSVPEHVREAVRQGRMDAMGEVIPRVRVRVSVEGPDAEAISRSSGWGLAEALQLRDAQGRPWDRQRTSSSQDGDTGRIELELEFADWARERGAPTELTWTIATQTRTLSVPFEFRDIPLPAMD